MRILAILVLALASGLIHAGFIDEVKQVVKDFKEGDSWSDIAQGVFDRNPGLKEKLSTELQHLKEIALAVIQGKDPQQIVKAALDRHPEVKARLDQACSFTVLQQIEYVKTACNFINGANQRSILGNIGNKFKQEFEKLKQIAKQITQGRSPIEIVKELVKTGTHKALEKVCKISFVRHIAYVDQACQAIENNPVDDVPAQPEEPVDPEPTQPEESAPVDDAPAAPHTRGFNFGQLTSAISQGSQLINFGKDIDSIKSLVNVIKNTKDPLEIAKAVVQLGLQDKIVGLCKIDVLRAVPVVDQACDAIEPIVGLLSKFIPSKTRGFNFDKFTSGLTQGAQLINLGKDIDNIKNLVNVIKDTKDPLQIAQAVVQLGLQDKIVGLCNIDVLRGVPVVAKACNIIEPAVSLLNQVVPPRTRGFNFGKLTGALAQGSQLINFGKDIESFKNLVNVIKDTKDPGQIVQAVIQLGLQDKIVGLCNIDVLRAVPVVDQGCDIIEPAVGLLNQFTGSKKRGLLDLFPAYTWGIDLILSGK